MQRRLGHCNQDTTENTWVPLPMFLLECNCSQRDHQVLGVHSTRSHWWSIYTTQHKLRNGYHQRRTRSVGTVPQSVCQWTRRTSPADDCHRYWMGWHSVTITTINTSYITHVIWASLGINECAIQHSNILLFSITNVQMLEHPHTMDT